MHFKEPWPQLKRSNLRNMKELLVTKINVYKKKNAFSHSSIRS